MRVILVLLRFIVAMILLLVCYLAVTFSPIAIAMWNENRKRKQGKNHVQIE